MLTPTELPDPVAVPRDVPMAVRALVLTQGELRRAAAIQGARGGVRTCASPPRSEWDRVCHTHLPLMEPRMAQATLKRQNFDVTPEQEAEIAWLREALGVSSSKDAVLRAVRIAAVLSREASEGRHLMVSTPGGRPERLVIPELERPMQKGWRYLVERDHPWQRQMSFKGRRLLAATVWRDMVVNGQTAEEAAEEWDLPVEAVHEAVRWCEGHRALLEMEAREEARRLASAGVVLAPAR